MVFSSPTHFSTSRRVSRILFSVIDAARELKVIGRSGVGYSNVDVDAAKRVGAAIAEAARERQIEKVVLNRNGFLYHGRVRALAEAAREAGLQF